MRIRKLLARGAVVAAVMAGGITFTAGAAEAGTGCGYNWNRVMYYTVLSGDDWANYNHYYSIQDYETAGEWLSLYQMDYSAMIYYQGRFDACNVQEP